MKKLFKVSAIPYLLAFLFFIISLFTLYDYGMNWDSPNHFGRGQAYLRYILTGKTDYNGMPSFCRNEYNLSSIRDFKTGETCDRTRPIRVSEYESPLLDFKWAQANAYGHPAFTDLMISISNQVFFKWLGLVEDIEAYHLFGIFVTFLLVVIVVRWMHRTYGIFPSIISGLAVATFPLLFSEQHFNVKDPAIASFFTVGIYFFYRGITEKKISLVLLSAIFGGFSFATKINYIFAPFILGVWFLAYILGEMHSSYREKKIRNTKEALKKLLDLVPIRILVALGFYPIIIVSIFFFSWPALWVDPINSLKTVFGFYKDVGMDQCTSSFWPLSETFKCWDLTTVRYIFYTIPPITLLFFVIGIAYSVKKIKSKNWLPLLWMSFFIVTIARVTLPIASVYGGLRQIMEFIAPMGLIAGLGALYFSQFLAQFLKKWKISKKGVLLFIVFLYIPIVVNLVRLHPNENVYFNGFMGGLRGAYDKSFPGYGNTYGNVYLQIIEWLNKNSVEGAKIALLSGNAQNIPRSRLREDIFLQNFYRSGFNQDGEYLISILTQDTPFRGTFRHKYVERWLNPAYIFTIDNVEIFKIWRNEKGYLKKGINVSREKEVGFAEKLEDGYSILALDEKVSLKRLEVYTTPECEELMKVHGVAVSKDGLKYIDLVDPFEDFTEYEKGKITANLFYLFLEDEASYIKINSVDESVCREIIFKVYAF